MQSYQSISLEIFDQIYLKLYVGSANECYSDVEPRKCCGLFISILNNKTKICMNF